jgi:hypothetical protein
MAQGTEAQHFSYPGAIRHPGSAGTAVCLTVKSVGGFVKTVISRDIGNRSGRGAALQVL